MAVSFWRAAGVLGLGDFAYKAVVARQMARAGRSLMFIRAFVWMVNMDENKFLVGIIPESVSGCLRLRNAWAASAHPTFFNRFLG